MTGGIFLTRIVTLAVFCLKSLVFQVIDHNRGFRRGKQNAPGTSYISQWRVFTEEFFVTPERFVRAMTLPISNIS